jgi:hypothetical protein
VKKGAVQMPKVIVPEDITKLKRQIAALEHQVKVDTCGKDRKVHQDALDDLKAAMKERRGWENGET